MPDRILKRIHPYSPARNGRLPADAYASEGKGALLTVRADRGAPFASNPPLCDRVVELRIEMRIQYDCWIYVYCLMPDHLHLVAGPWCDGSSVLTFVDRFKGRSTNESWGYGWTGKLWQKRSHDHVLRRAEALEDVGTYVLDNPVRAGLVDSPEDWPWAGILDLPD